MQSSLSQASNMLSSAASSSTNASNSVPFGINLRKEAQKIDLKQFDFNNVDHVEPIMSVMRPPTGHKNPTEKANDHHNHQHTAADGNTKQVRLNDE